MSQPDIRKGADGRRPTRTSFLYTRQPRDPSINRTDRASHWLGQRIQHPAVPKNEPAAEIAALSTAK
ncbi:hypothetical protein ETAA8_50130 [Anatilimnocola aggregata]|uniref:Uncharacterized protein n=1 Tax=Anatilimnocola aggregata TaxID=2528021 RepID=A0A517YI51_9BACT|nr:hypothetical protein ETAA8_50130 [Anatilimnocola aggregata]